MSLAEDIAKLRNETGAGVMDCKKALEEANGDFKKAKEILSNNAQAIAKKKAERSTKQGLIESYIHGSKIGVLVEINCESDFVGRSPQFKEMAHAVAMQIASMNPKTVEELLDQEYIMDPKQKIKEFVEKYIAQFGENIQIRRFTRYELGEEIQ